MTTKTGYVYHELFGWHDTGTNAGFFPSDPSKGLQPFLIDENAETKKRIHELIVVSDLLMNWFVSDLDMQPMMNCY
jgi:hypothetical protein